MQVYTSLIGFVIQVWLTSRIQRFLGIGFALMILPIGLGSTGGAHAGERRSCGRRCSRACSTRRIRYTVDKTTREILFLPLPADLKRQAKPFVDVTVDRVGQGRRAR